MAKTKTSWLKVRATPDVLSEWRRHARSRGMDLSAFVRAAVRRMAEQPDQPTPAEVRQALGELRLAVARGGGLLDQLAHHLNAGGEVGERAAAEALRAHVAVLERADAVLRESRRAA